MEIHVCVNIRSGLPDNCDKMDTRQILYWHGSVEIPLVLRSFETQCWSAEPPESFSAKSAKSVHSASKTSSLDALEDLEDQVLPPLTFTDFVASSSLVGRAQRLLTNCLVVKLIVSIQLIVSILELQNQNNNNAISFIL